MKKHKYLYSLAIFVFLASSLSWVSTSAQVATLSAVLDVSPLSIGPVPLTGLTMTAEVGGTATGPINYYFYCNGENNDSTIVVPGYAHSVVGTSSTTATTPVGVCDDVYDTIGTYLAKVIVERGGIATEERRTVGVFNPIPQVNLQIRPLGTTDWSDWMIDLDYNTAAEIRWTFSGASFCTMSGDWAGTKTAPGQESTGNLTEARMYIYTLECNTSSGLLTDTVLAMVAPPTLFGSISATPSSGTAPLSGAVLTANVTGGTAVGTINYTFYCNRSDAGTNITLDHNYKVDGINSLTLSAPGNTCNSVYVNPGTYTAKIIIERGGIAREYRTTVTVNPPPPPTITFTANPAGTTTNPIPYGTSTTLNWTVSDAASCTGTGSTAWVSATKTLPTGSWSTGNLTTTTTYNLSCTGPGGTTSRGITVNVEGPPPPPYVELWVSVEQAPTGYTAITVPHGTSVFLNWNTGDPEPTSCDGYSVPPGNWDDGPKNTGGGWDYTGNLVGSMDPLVINHYTFTITCYNSAGVSRSDSVVVNVLPDYDAPIVDLQVRPVGGEWDTDGINIDYNTAAELMWAVENSFTGTVCEASEDWSGTRSSTGGIQNTGILTSSRQYTLTCTGPGGVDSDTVLVGVGGIPVPTLDLSVSDTSVDYGDSVRIDWSSTNANSCEASSDSGRWIGTRMPSGSETIRNLTDDDRFTLNCVGGGGTITRSVSVNVGAADPVTLSVTAKPAGESIYGGEEIEIECGTAADVMWEVTNAGECWSWGEWGERQISATGGTYRTQSFTEPGQHYYAVWCTNLDQRDREEDAVYVTVGECEPDRPIVFENPLEQGDFRNILNSFSGLIRMIAIILAAIMIIISGIIIITSIDDRERLNKGKNMLKWALIGLAIALASSYIIGLLEEIIGSS